MASFLEMLKTYTCYLALLGLGSSAVVQADALDVYRWEFRLLVVAAPSADDPNLRRQQIEAARDPAGWADRKLVLVEIISGELKAQSDGAALAGDGRQVLRGLGLDGKGFSAVVVGLDGTVKLRQARPISNEALYALIDSMPMRREELRLRDEP